MALIKLRLQFVKENGSVIGMGSIGLSNYQIYGVDIATQSIREAVKSTLKKASIKITEVEHAVLGLTGMGLPMDRIDVEERLWRTFPAIPFALVNDA